MSEGRASPSKGPPELDDDLVAEGLEGQEVAVYGGRTQLWFQTTYTSLPERNVQRKRVFVPRLRDSVSYGTKLDYVALMIHGMSTRFPTMLSVLENTRGHEARVRRLAREALVNTWALERIHEEQLNRWKGGLATLPDSFAHRSEVIAAVADMEQSRPPYVELADGSFSRVRLDVEAVRARLIRLMQ